MQFPYGGLTKLEGPGTDPCLAAGTDGSLVLPGYGVELAIKNMEYNARDDTQQVCCLWYGK